MEIHGSGKMHIYAPSEEYPHQPSSDLHWQESFLLHFWDVERQAGAFMRIGHEANREGGRLLIFCNLVTPDGVFHRVDVLPRQPGDVHEKGISCDGGALRYVFDGKDIWWFVEENGISAKLRVEDFHAAVDCYPKKDLANYTPQHIDVACRVTGTITTQGNTHAVDGMGMRDHGWGVRDWGTLVSQRWNYGVFDRDNSFYVVAGVTRDDQILKFGWVQRGDKIFYADKVETVAYIEADGVSNRGGFIRLTLSTGEIYEAHFEAATPCVTFWLNETLVLDNFCKVRWGDRIGAGNFETNCNITRGTHRPRVFDAGTIDDNGWHPFVKAGRRG